MRRPQVLPNPLKTSYRLSKKYYSLLNWFIMKKILHYTAYLFIGLFMLSSCNNERCDNVYIRFDPVYVSLETVRQDIRMSAPQEMETTGKIYIYQQYLFINEPEKGVHIFDNTSPSNPVGLGFLDIPGNVDIAVRGNYLYADSYIDLVVFDLSDPENPNFVQRLENVFPNIYPIDAGRGLLVKYEETEVREPIDCKDLIDQMRWQEDVLFARPLAADAARAQVNSGTGGSLARFTILDKFMYAVDDYSLKVFDLSIPERPDLANDIHLGWGIETIFPYGDKLFIGSNNAMFIYDASTPANPQMLSTFWHANSCDPIYVSEDVAFVTLRDGTPCRNGVNQLEVLDVSDLENPRLLKTYPMHHPIGLSVNKKSLFLCEDDMGLKVFDISDLMNIDQNLLSHETGFTTYDIITFDDLGIVIGKDGLVQYDISDPTDLKVLSTISVKR